LQYLNQQPYFASSLTGLAEMKPCLDRTAFQAGTHEETEQ
jgi:hypothetical protein